MKPRGNRNKLLKKYHLHVLYHVPNTFVDYPIPCILDKHTKWNINSPRIIKFDNDMCLDKFSSANVSWNELYENWKDAQNRVRYLRRIYQKGFYKQPYLSVNILIEHKQTLLKIERDIKEGLKDYPGFLGVRFCDVGAGGIQILGFHRDIPRYVFVGQTTIKKDFSNKDKVAKEFMSIWRELDNPDGVSKYKNFLKYGEEFGWD